MSEVVCPKSHSSAVVKPIFKPRSHAYESEVSPLSFSRFDLLGTGIKPLRRWTSALSQILGWTNAYCNNGNSSPGTITLFKLFLYSPFSLICWVFPGFSSGGEAESILCCPENCKNSKELRESPESMIKGVQNQTGASHSLWLMLSPGMTVAACSPNLLVDAEGLCVFQWVWMTSASRSTRNTIGLSMQWPKVRDRQISAPWEKFLKHRNWSWAE